MGRKSRKQVCPRWYNDSNSRGQLVKYTWEHVKFPLIIFCLLLLAIHFYQPILNYFFPIHPIQHLDDEPSNQSISQSTVFHLLNYEYESMEFNSNTSDNVTGFKVLIVPDIVHYVQLDNCNIEFIPMISMMSVLRHHRPRFLMIHTDCEKLHGKYWQKVLELSQSQKNTTEIRVNHIKRPWYIFNRKFSSVFHASDVVRIQVLQQFGGIYFDNDVYVVQSLHRYRTFEFALGWHPGQFIGNQVLIGHPKARFLSLWLESYGQYRPDLWYYNAGELPTTSILKANPSLVHRVTIRFGVHMLAPMLYREFNPHWKQEYDTIHLLARHHSYLGSQFDGITEFNEDNIGSYNRTFGEMARLAYFGDQRMRN